MADGPFVGPTYPLTSRAASIARTVNLMPVPNEPGNERAGWTFKDVPGLVNINQTFPPIYLTSWPYALFADDGINADHAAPQFGRMFGVGNDAINGDHAIPQSGTLVTQLHTYTYALYDSINADLAIPQSGTLIVQLHVYPNALYDSINADLAVPQSGTLVVQLIVYSNALYDSINADHAIPQSGTLA